MRLPGDSGSFCIDTLNGDGLKNAEMVYLLPDEIFYSFGNCPQQLISSSFHARLDKLVSTCRERQYGVITLRYWVDCPRSLSREHPETRPLTTWSETEHLKQYLNLICMEKKWTRNPPGLTAFRAAKNCLQEQGVRDILFTSDRWFNDNLYDRNGSIREELAHFKPGPERWLAILFVMAPARAICRSKDSTFSEAIHCIREKKSEHTGPGRPPLEAEAGWQTVSCDRKSTQNHQERLVNRIDAVNYQAQEDEPWGATRSARREPSGIQRQDR